VECCSRPAAISPGNTAPLSIAPDSSACTASCLPCTASPSEADIALVSCGSLYIKTMYLTAAIPPDGKPQRLSAANGQ
jgi:hypothetical protein